MIGERYILGGENVVLADMLADSRAHRRAAAAAVAHPARRSLIPVAFVAEAKARLTGREPFATLDGLRMAEHCMFFTAAKAERDLGFRARPYRRGAGRRDRLVSRRRLSRRQAAGR